MRAENVIGKPAGTSVIDDSNMISKLAHDLRTYLRTILTRVQLVQSSGTAHLCEEDRSFLAEAATAAHDMGGLLSAMVAYSEGPLDGEENLRVLVRGVLIERKAALAEAGATVEVENELEARVPAGLKSVLKELFVNACRFRSSARPLHVVIATRLPAALTHEDSVERIEVTVTDNGIGVDPACLEKIFAPFYRLHSREEFPGHGLGLAACRRFVERLGGAIAAEPAPGNGLMVRVTVPVSARLR